MAAAPRCSFCPAVAVRQGRPAGSGDRYVAMCGSDRCATELANRPNLALIGRPMGVQLGRWLDGLAAKLNAEVGPAIIAAAKKAANNSRVDTSTLQGYTFLVFPQTIGEPPEQRVYVGGLILGRADTSVSILIDRTLNTPELLATYVRMMTATMPTVIVTSSPDRVFIIQRGKIRYTIAPLMPVGSVTEPSFWVIEGDGGYLD